MNRAALVSVEEIAAAAQRIRGTVRRTPLLATELGTTGASLWLKPECLQVTGSFKFRGACNAIGRLGPEERRRGVITHSSGNHGQALARAARAAGIQATVVMPMETAEVKRVATEKHGATVVLVDVGERAAAVERLQAESGAVFVPPFNHPDVIAGQGTIGLEIAADLADAATVWVPVSGGGLISGIATALKAKNPDAQVIGVEPDLAGDLAEGFARGERVSWDRSRTSRTIADGLRVGAVGELNWAHINAYVDDVVTVSEAEIKSAMRALALDSKVVAEPSGAVSMAGYTRYAAEHAPGPAVAVVSGGNVDPDRLAEALRT